MQTFPDTITPPLSTAPSRSLWKGKAGHWFRQYGILIAFAVLCTSLTFLNEYFLTRGNILNILQQTSINGILALGMSLVILTGGIDLSVGSVLAYSAMISASIVTGDNPQPLYLAIPLGLIVGAGLGLVNGFTISYLKIPPFVATLGMLSVARGLTYAYTNGMPIPGLSESFLQIGEATPFGIPMPALIFFILFGLLWMVMTKTTYGRTIYAIGGNAKSARTAGIRTKPIILSVYALSGLLAGLAGMLLAARTSAALPQAGVSYELDAIAAVVIGGTSLSGGVGSLLGTLLGALIIGTLNNGLDLLGVSSAYQQIVKGSIIVIAVLLDYRRLQNQ